MDGAATIAPLTGHGTSVGTCGELLQGTLRGGRRFHVTCPVELEASMTVRLASADATRISGLPAWATTTARALRRTAELLELDPVSIEVERASALGRAKGMASSTADVIAAARALASAAGHELDPPALAGLATSLEASDGVMYDGVVALDQHDGTLLREWNWSPEFTIAMFVPAQERITAEVRFEGQRELAGDYEALLHDLDAAMSKHDPEAVARVATRSAELNERFAPNPLLPGMRPAVGDVGAAGLCVGHSGTVCGLLFAPGADAAGRAQRAVDRLLPTLPSATQALVTRMAG